MKRISIVITFSLLILILILILTSHTISARTINDSTVVNVADSLPLNKRNVVASDYNPQIPSYAPLSPQVQQFMRYGEIPVGQSTGIPNINIPIYTIQFEKITIPINISYHAGGNRVQDIASPVGLGWSLNAGGIISTSFPDYNRRIRDINKIKYRSASELKNAMTKDRESGRTGDWYQFIAPGGDIDRVGGGHQSDRNYYSFNGNVGTFMYDLMSKGLKTVPYSPLKPIKTKNGYNIIDTEGYTWIFEGSFSSMSSRSNTPTSYEYYLKQIASPNSNDTINFTYISDGSYSMLTTPESSYYGSTTIQGTPSHILEDRRKNIKEFTYDFMYHSIVLLSKITWKNSEINFTYASDREDIGYSFLILNSKGRANKYRLKSISVRTNNKEIVNATLDNNSYLGFTQKDYRMLLKGITINDEHYRFNYNSFELPPYNAYVNSSELQYFTDFWGYYNGSSSLTKIPFVWSGSDNYSINVPSTTYTRSYLSIKEPSESSTQAGILTEIIYPTGGWAKFSYEINRADENKIYDNEGLGRSRRNNPIGEPFGGLRIAKIEYSDKTTKRYEYFDGQPSIQITPDHFFTLKSFCDSFSENGVVKTMWYDTSSEMSGVFAEVGSSEGTGYPFSETGSPSIYYKQVKEYIGGEGKDIGMTEYYFSKRNQYTDICDCNDPLISPIVFSKYKNCDFGIVEPYLNEKNQYKIDPSTNKLEIISRTVNSYKDNICNERFIKGIDVSHEFEFRPSLEVFIKNSVQNMYPYTDFFATYYNKFRIYDMYAIRNVSLLDSSTTIEYSSNGNTTITTKYTYDSKYRLLSPITTTMTNSNGVTIKESVTHPFNYTTSVYADMVSKNIISPVINKKRDANGQIISLQNNYRKLNNYFVLDNVQMGTGTDLQTRQTYHNYDNYSNPIYISQDEATKIVYLWGYNGQHPVAEIKNATYNDVKTALGEVAPESLSPALTPNFTLIDGLRTKLPNAHITTYEYAPLIGITKKTDPRGLVTTYEYDAFGRLKATYIIEDKAKRVLQTYEYNYKNK